jgi:DNA (cytosine-5)-methyltransferase 1
MIDILGAELAPLSWHALKESCYGRRRGRADDLFCGMGGMLAAFLLAGGEGNVSANHWNKAFAAHSANFGHVEHMLGDLSVLDPSRMPGTADILLACPECRLHSKANNWREAIAELAPWDPRREGERSRCTMWCPQRLAAQRDYDYVILENVVEVTTWNQFGNWLKEWEKLGYVVEQRCLNAAFFGAPQSRDRIVFVIRRKGAPAPNLDFRPRCVCWHCERQVFSIQTWKPEALRNATPIGPVGKFGKQGQYLYCCPRCMVPSSPYIIPADTAIDHSIRATRLRDRKVPLRPNTMGRLSRAWARRGQITQWLTLDGPEPGTRISRPLWLPALPAHASAQLEHAQPGVLVALRNNTHARDLSEPAQAVCAAGNHHAIVGPDQRGAVPRSADVEPIATLTTGGNHMVVGANRPNESARDAAAHPAATVTAAGKLFVVRDPGTDMLVQTGGNTYERPGSGYVRAWPLAGVAPTQSATVERGVLQAPRPGTQLVIGASTSTSERNAGSDPAPTQVTTVRASLLGGPDGGAEVDAADPAFLASYYGNATALRALSMPAPTQTTRDRHAVLVPAGGTRQEATIDVDLEPSPTRLTRDSYGVADGVALEDCTFRMLVPKEAQALMDLIVRPDGQPYLTVELDDITGTDAVRLAGNAVCQTLFANVINRVFCAREGTMLADAAATPWPRLARRRR